MNRLPTFLPFAFVLCFPLTLNLGCGGDAGGVGPGSDASGTTPSGSPAQAGTPSGSASPEARSAMCDAGKRKKCDDFDSSSCTSRYVSASSCWTDKMLVCITAVPDPVPGPPGYPSSSSCDGFGTNGERLGLSKKCDEDARKACEPAYPNVNYIAGCMDRNLQCKSEYDPGVPKSDMYYPTKLANIVSTVDRDCRALAMLDDAARARGAACVPKPCAQFAACIGQLSP